jgi:hypothetical protein
MRRSRVTVLVVSTRGTFLQSVARISSFRQVLGFLRLRSGQLGIRSPPADSYRRQITCAAVEALWDVGPSARWGVGDEHMAGAVNDSKTRIQR